MKFLKALLVIVVIILIGYLIAGFFAPKKIDVSVTEEIQAPPEIVYHYVSTLPEWEKWNVYSQMEGIEISYGEKTQGKGASYSWTMDGKEGGNLKIVEAHQPTSMRTRLQFADWEGYSYVDWTFKSREDNTEVTWKMTSDSEMPFYLRGMMLFMEGSMKSDFKKSLENLKKLIESAQKG